MIVIELIIIFVSGMGFGAIAVTDEYEYKLDKCDSNKVELIQTLDRCQEEHNLCKIRKGC